MKKLLKIKEKEDNQINFSNRQSKDIEKTFQMFFDRIHKTRLRKQSPKIQYNNKIQTIAIKINGIKQIVSTIIGLINLIEGLIGFKLICLPDKKDRLLEDLSTYTVLWYLLKKHAKENIIIIIYQNTLIVQVHARTTQVTQIQ